MEYPITPAVRLLRSKRSLGTRKNLPVYAQNTIFGLTRIYINGGKRGFLISIDPNALRAVLGITEVDVAITQER